jgi:RNase P/RNase MRP subunit POP5
MSEKIDVLDLIIDVRIVPKILKVSGTIKGLKLKI